MKILSQKKGFSILGMLIVAAIIGVLIWLCLQEREEIPVGTSESMLKEAGVDTRNYKTTLDSTKALIGEMEKKAPDLEKLMDTP